MMSIQELRKLKEADLYAELSKARFNFGKLRFTINSGQELAVHKFKAAKKHIAHILTVITEKKNITQ